MTENFARAPSRLSSALRCSTLFSSLSDEELAAVEARLTPVTRMSGEVLFQQGDPGDSLYVIVSGRLVVSHRSDDHTERIVAELGHGEIVGEMGLVCNEPRSATVLASRDTELARLSAAGLDSLIPKYAQPVYSSIIRQLAARLRNETAGVHTRKPAPICVAIAGISRNAPVPAFTDRLTGELARMGTALRLNSERVDSLFGIAGAAQARSEGGAHGRLADWLSAQETHYRKVVYEADMVESEWTARCVRQCDLLVLVARVGDDPAQGGLRAAELTRVGPSGKPVVLVLLHDDGTAPPQRTRDWTSCVKPVRHFHIRRDQPRDRRFNSVQLLGAILAEQAHQLGEKLAVAANPFQQLVPADRFLIQVARDLAQASSEALRVPARPLPFAPCTVREPRPARADGLAWSDIRPCPLPNSARGRPASPVRSWQPRAYVGPFPFLWLATPR